MGAKIGGSSSLPTALETHMVHPLQLNTTDGMSIARVWTCRYPKRPPRRGGHFESWHVHTPRNRHAVGDAKIESNVPDLKAPKSGDLRVWSNRVELMGANTGSSSALPTACLSRGYGRAGTHSDRLSEVVILSTGTPIPVQWACRRRCRYRADSRQRNIQNGRPTGSTRCCTRCCTGRCVDCC